MSDVQPNVHNLPNGNRNLSVQNGGNSSSGNKNGSGGGHHRKLGLCKKNNASSNNLNLSNVHSEPAINRLSVTFANMPTNGLIPKNGNLALSTPGNGVYENAAGGSCCAGSGSKWSPQNDRDRRKASGPILSGASRGSTPETNSEDEPVLRISVPFLNNPLLKKT